LLTGDEKAVGAEVQAILDTCCTEEGGVVELRLDPGPDPEDKFSEVLCRVIDEIGRAGRDKVLEFLGNGLDQF